MADSTGISNNNTLMLEHCNRPRQLTVEMCLFQWLIKIDMAKPFTLHLMIYIDLPSNVQNMFKQKPLGEHPSPP